MKNDIKEIINDLQRVADRKCYPEDILCGSIAQEWADYITNLQEELEEEKRIEQEDLKIIMNLQEENEQLKKKLNCKERFSKIMPEDTEFIILSKADYDRQQENILTGEDNEN